MSEDTGDFSQGNIFRTAIDMRAMQGRPGAMILSGLIGGDAAKLYKARMANEYAQMQRESELHEAQMNSYREKSAYQKQLSEQAAKDAAASDRTREGMVSATNAKNKLIQEEAESKRSLQGGATAAEDSKNKAIQAEMLRKRSAANQVMIDAEGQTWLDQIKKDPRFASQSKEEQEDFFRSPEFQGKQSVATAYRLYSKAQKDPLYQGVLDQYLADSGYGFQTDKDGKTYLSNGDGSRRFEQTYDQFGRVADAINQESEKELQTRLDLSGTRDNVMKNTMRKAVKAGSSAYGGSYAKTQKGFQEYLSGFSPREKYEYLLVSNYEDLMSEVKQTTEEQAQLLPQMKAIATQMGIRMDEGRGLVLRENGTSQTYQQYLEELKQTNPIGRGWANHIAGQNAANAVKLAGSLKAMDEAYYKDLDEQSKRREGLEKKYKEGYADKYPGWNESDRDKAAIQAARKEEESLRRNSPSGMAQMRQAQAETPNGTKGVDINGNEIITQNGKTYRLKKEEGAKK